MSRCGRTLRKASTGEKNVSGNREQAKVSFVKDSTQQLASSAGARVIVRLDASESAIEKDFVSDQRDQAKVSFVENPIPQVASSATPRLAVRLAPSEKLIESETSSEGGDRTKASSAVAPPRLKLKGGADAKTFRTTQSTLKILTASRVDSPPRPEKPE